VRESYLHVRFNDDSQQEAEDQQEHDHHVRHLNPCPAASQSIRVEHFAPQSISGRTHRIHHGDGALRPAGNERAEHHGEERLHRNGKRGEVLTILAKQPRADATKEAHGGRRQKTSVPAAKPPAADQYTS
jgi:hypothetical protein